MLFDNLMCAVGLFGYEATTRSGIAVGVAPIEDLLYATAFALVAATPCWLNMHRGIACLCDEVERLRATNAALASQLAESMKENAALTSDLVRLQNECADVADLRRIVELLDGTQSP